MAARGGGRGRGRQRSDLLARILVAVPAIAVVLVLVALGGWVFTVGMVLVGVLCLGEAFDLLRAGHPVRLGGFLGLIGLIVAAHAGGPPAVLGAAAAAVPLVFGIAVLMPRAGAPGLAVTLFSLWWIGLGLAHAVMLRDLHHGNSVVIDVLAGTFFGDTAAYLGGRAFGRRALAPTISPSKSVEGLAFGFVGAVAAVMVGGLYQDWLSNGQALLLGLAVAAAAPIGDLFESYIKRDRGTKDTGRVFGAHGGALDRLDAVLFTAVAGYYVWQAMV